MSHHLAVKGVYPRLPTAIRNQKKNILLFSSLRNFEKNIKSFFMNRFNIECSPLNKIILIVRGEYFQLSADTQGDL
jgi:hypothetical protein